MNQQLREMFQRAEGRYFTDIESAALRNYADGLLARMETVGRIERAEPQIITSVLQAVMQRFPNLSSEYGPETEQRMRRDQTLVLRYATFSLILLDPNFIYDKLAVWLRTILLALCQPDPVIYGLQQLAEACRAHLSPEDASALVPYIQVVVQEFEANRSKAS